MKANHLALLFVFAASIATAADQAPVSGHWQIHALGKISGTLSVPEFSVQGDFTATPAK